MTSSLFLGVLISVGLFINGYQDQDLAVEGERKGLVWQILALVVAMLFCGDAAIEKTWVSVPIFLSIGIIELILIIHRFRSENESQ